MTTATAFEAYLDRLTRGGRLAPDEIRALATTTDILSLGMLADALRRRLHDRRTTFLRVAESPFELAFADGIPPAARELRLTGSPPSLTTALGAVAAAKAVAGERTIAAFAWEDVERWAEGARLSQVLSQLKAAGLGGIADLALDQVRDLRAALEALGEAGFDQLRLTVRKSEADRRTDLLLQVGELQEIFGSIQSISPLPTSLATFRPTTGYEDVKMVAIARLAAPGVPSIQVDWRRYGPKLAQVALTFGADDVDNVSPFEEALEGRRRAPLAEIHRNVEAAGLIPIERDSRFAVPS
jgi:aminodeoxyfutalosine synthase